MCLFNVVSTVLFMKLSIATICKYENALWRATFTNHLDFYRTLKMACACKVNVAMAECWTASQIIRSNSGTIALNSNSKISMQLYWWFNVHLIRVPGVSHVRFVSAEGLSETGQCDFHSGYFSAPCNNFFFSVKQSDMCRTWPPAKCYRFVPGKCGDDAVYFPLSSWSFPRQALNADCEIAFYIMCRRV